MLNTLKKVAHSQQVTWKPIYFKKMTPVPYIPEVLKGQQLTGLGR